MPTPARIALHHHQLLQRTLQGATEQKGRMTYRGTVTTVLRSGSARDPYRWCERHLTEATRVQVSRAV